MEIITSRQNSLISRIAKLQSSRKQRIQERAYVGDGTKLLEEAVRWAPDLLEAVVLQEGTPCPVLPPHVRAVQISRQLMQQVSRMEAPEGALFLCRMPEPERGQSVQVQPGCLVLDGVQDPGNVGTILRTADALDVPVLLTDGCADPWNSKTVRATMGAIFRTPPCQISHEELVLQCRQNGIPLLASALSERAEDLRNADLRSAAVIIGSEGRGVSPYLLEASDGQVIIPMTPRCESLNAASAATIFLWQLTTL